MEPVLAYGIQIKSRGVISTVLVVEKCFFFRNKSFYGPNLLKKNEMRGLEMEKNDFYFVLGAGYWLSAGWKGAGNGAGS